MLADLRPALLWPLPNTCPEVSLRCRLGWRADAGAVPFAVGGFEGWRAAEEGARLADMEGDGDEREAVTPLVWMPGGMGRLILVGGAGAGAAGAATPVGAMDRASCRRGSNVGAISYARGCFVRPRQVRGCCLRRKLGRHRLRRCWVPVVVESRSRGVGIRMPEWVVFGGRSDAMRGWFAAAGGWAVVRSAIDG
jgi:hypothetical protein